MTAPSQHMQQPPPPQQQQQMTSPYNTSVEQAGLTQALHNLSINSSNSGWVADSGATSHMPAAHGNLASLTPVSNFPPVIVGNGSHLSVSHIGSSTIPTVARSLSVNDILVAPNIIQDLLSVRKLTRDNLISMEFDPWGLSLKDLRTKAHLLRTNSDGDLYPLLPQSTALLLTTQAASKLWHRRLGHPGASSLFQKPFPCNNLRHLSQACQLGKHVRPPFSASTSSSPRPFFLLHCDLWTLDRPCCHSFRIQVSFNNC
jgi:hypothetical protein